MTTTSRHTEEHRALARLAYTTFEPYHLVAYFGPHVDATREGLGIGWLGSYTAMRAAPLGAVPGSVVAATFFGFKAPAITKAWGLALDRHTPDELDGIRTQCVDTGLRAVLGDLVDSPDLPPLAARLRDLTERMDHGGRALSAAYAAQPWPDSPHLTLWQTATLWREWRGDAHNAALVAAGLRPVEALVLYDGWVAQTDPRASPTRRREILQPTRRWTDQEWSDAAEALERDGLAHRTRDGSEPAVTLTDRGLALREDLERSTDDASAAVWVDVDDAEALIASFRPFSKPVIKAGILPGTQKRA